MHELISSHDKFDDEYLFKTIKPCSQCNSRNIIRDYKLIKLSTTQLEMVFYIKCHQCSGVFSHRVIMEFDQHPIFHDLIKAWNKYQEK